MTFRLWLACLFVLSLGLFACDDPGEDPYMPREPPSVARIEEVCREWARVACAKNLECGVLSGTLDACVGAKTSDCIGDVQEEALTCRANQVDAIESCSASFEDESCSDYCSSNGFCFRPCIYFCPAG